jgi:hypothetical protein
MIRSASGSHYPLGAAPKQRIYLVNVPMEATKISIGIFPSWGLGNYPTAISVRSIGTFYTSSTTLGASIHGGGLAAMVDQHEPEALGLARRLNGYLVTEQHQR